MKKREMSILHGQEIMKMEVATGFISRPEIKMKASGEWRVIGAVRFNNFGRIVERASFGQIISGYIKDWQYKNGQQKWHVQDIDHGTYRTWMSPNHSIF